jgi:hypothetical protein
LERVGGKISVQGHWYLREGESRDKLGEWLKKKSVRSTDQRRMLQAITHTFLSNSWRHKIWNQNGKESDKCDLCKAVWIEEGRFTTEDALPVQDLGHIQNTCKSLSKYTRWHTTDVDALL